MSSRSLRKSKNKKRSRGKRSKQSVNRPKSQRWMSLLPLHLPTVTLQWSWKDKPKLSSFQRLTRRSLSTKKSKWRCSSRLRGCKWLQRMTCQWRPRFSVKSRSLLRRMSFHQRCLRHLQIWASMVLQSALWLTKNYSQHLDQTSLPKKTSNASSLSSNYHQRSI